MTQQDRTPYVAVEIISGRLVRVCPECLQQIIERTDKDGVVSNNFGEHYGTEHDEQEPERQRGYLLSLQTCRDGNPGSSREALRGASQMILETVKRQIPELDWEIAYRLTDLPEGEPVLDAAQVLCGSWQRENADSQLRQVRWYRRTADGLIFTPTRAQLDEWDAARERARDVRSALIERHRDQLPVFTGSGLEDWDEYWVERKEREDEIAINFDAERDAAQHRFYTGDHRWLAMLNAAIDDLGIPEDELEDERAHTRTRIAEAEAAPQAR